MPALHHLGPRLKLGKTRRYLVYGLMAALLLSGLAWCLAHWAINRDPDMPPLPLEGWSMKLHGAAAMGLLYLTGTMLHAHMLHGWRMHKNRKTGLTMAGCGLLLALTGYGLYYFNGELLRHWTEWAHWVAGFVCVPLLTVHIYSGRRARRNPQ